MPDKLPEWGARHLCIDVLADGQVQLKKALSLLWHYGSESVVAWEVIDGKLVLYSYTSRLTANKLPFKAGLDATASLVWGWLEETKPTASSAYGGDGGNRKGFRLTSGQASGDWDAMATIESRYTYYGK